MFLSLLIANPCICYISYQRSPLAKRQSHFTLIFTCKENLCHLESIFWPICLFKIIYISKLYSTYRNIRYTKFLQRDLPYQLIQGFEHLVPAILLIFSEKNTVISRVMLYTKAKFAIRNHLKYKL